MKYHLHKSKFLEFQHWIIRQDVTLLEPKGEWELLKWCTEDPLRPAIVFDNLAKEHLTLNQKAEQWWRQWNVHSKNKGSTGG